MCLDFERDRAEFFETCRRSGTLPGNDALKRTLSEADVREISRLERHAKDLGVIE